ncbi:MAG: condensin subunit ScpB [Candidatus Angelobacter sp.]|jgi:segregation and condensation protein B|nr:condensin subunit ScpB [Candidatus Angelobacter sp.]
MSIKGKLEAIIYAAEEPVSVDQLAAVLKESGLLDQLLAPPPAEESASTDESQPTEATEPKPKDPKAEKAEIKTKLRAVLDEMIADYAADNRGLEIRQVAGGYRMSTKPEHHDVVRSFAKSLKPPIRLSLQALETLAVIAYKQPVTAPEISEIRGVDSGGVLATLIDRKLITTAGRKAVIGRPILYKTTKDFLLRFGLKDVNELPSMEEFEKMTMDTGQDSLFDRTPVADATGIPDEAAQTGEAEQTSEAASNAVAGEGSSEINEA